MGAPRVARMAMHPGSHLCTCFQKKGPACVWMSKSHAHPTFSAQKPECVVTVQGPLGLWELCSLAVFLSIGLRSAWHFCLTMSYLRI